MAMGATPVRLFAICAILAGGAAGLRALGAADDAILLFWESPAIAAPDDDEAGPAKSEADTADTTAQDTPEATEYAASEAAQSCPPATLAQRSGLTHAELRVLESLSQRRRTLDEREANLRSETVLLEAAQSRLDTRVEELKGLRAEVEQLLGRLDEAEQLQIDSLVALYATMKPKDAARILPGLEDDVRLAVAAQMSDRALSPIIAAMSQEDAVSLTMLLARRHEVPETLSGRLEE